MTLDLVNLGLEIDRRRLSLGWNLQELARRAGLAEPTVKKVLKGQKVAPVSLGRVCATVDLEVRAPRIAQADESLGGYVRDHYKDYEGGYLVYRRTFDHEHRILCTRFRIFWSEHFGCLRFEERQTYLGVDNVHRETSLDGNFMVSNFIQLIHLMTVNKGAVRLITLSRLHSDTDTQLRGIVLTQFSIKQIARIPAVSPILFEKQPSMDEEAMKTFMDGKSEFLTSASPDFEKRCQELQAIEVDHAIFASYRHLQELPSKSTGASDASPTVSSRPSANGRGASSQRPENIQ